MPEPGPGPARLAESIRPRGAWHRRQDQWVRRCVVALIVVLVGRYYLWSVRAAGSSFDWGYDLNGYYDLLGRAFAHGRLYLPIAVSPALLAQPNPYDLAVDASLKWHDLALYNGRYYLYFGAAPAVLFFAPFRIVTGHDLPENFALFVICFGGFLFSCGSLLRLLRLAGLRAGLLLTALLLLALGLCQSVPYLLNRAAVYEVAIAGGYFCLSAAIYFLVRGLGSRRAPYWLAASGVMFGGAVASRPHLVFAGIVALAGFAVYCGRKVLRSHDFAAMAAGFALVGFAIGIYNYERFGSPFEFGFRYQLSGPGQNRIELAARNLTPGVYYMLLAKPELSPVFPWMRMVIRYPFDSAVRHPLPPEYFVEPSVGALWTAPFLLFALLPPSERLLARARAPYPAAVRAVLRIAGLSSVVILVFLVFTHLATHRYEVDFVAIGVFAAIANLGLHVGLRSGWSRMALGAVAASVIVYSAVANLALGLAGPYDHILQERPLRYVRLARWFSPVVKYRPVIDPAIEVALTARFTPYAQGMPEPLITIGHSHYCHFLYAEHPAGKLRLVSQTDDSKMEYELPDPGSREVAIGLTYSPQTHRIATTVDGRPALDHPVKMIVTAPEGVDIGRNVSDPGRTFSRFTGQLKLKLKRIGSPQCQRHRTQTLPPVAAERRG